MGILVLCSYKPNAGDEAALDAIVERHYPILRGEGLVGEAIHEVMRAKTGEIVEVFEWTSEEAARSAEGNKAVRAIWGEFAMVCDFVPLASIEECQTPFAHFAPVRPE